MKRAAEFFFQSCSSVCKKLVVVHPTLYPAPHKQHGALSSPHNLSGAVFATYPFVFCNSHV